MAAEATLTLAVILGMMALLATNRVGADVVMLGALTVLLVAGVLEPREAFAGFANDGLLTVACLYVVVAGLRHSGVVSLLTGRLLGRPSSELNAQARVMLPVAGLSAFMNNTPLVAIYLPMLDGFARRYGIAPSRLFLPLSYAAILGGVCTLIGTSTNVVVNGLILEHNRLVPGAPLTPFTMFTITPVGLPVAAAGLVYMIAFGRRLLPARQAPSAAADDERRQYTVAMQVEPSAPVVGRSLEAAGLRNLSGLYLAHIERGPDVKHAVGPDEVLHAGDVLVFVGALASVVELQQMRGLAPVTALPGVGRGDHRLTEAVIAPSSSLVGQTIRDGGFRTKYGGVIVAVHRHGERLKGKIGDVRLRAGDALIIEAPAGFAARHQDSTAFHLVTEHQGAAAPRHDRAWLALTLLGAFVAASSMGWLDTLTAALVAAVGMLAFQCTDGARAREAIDWQVLMVIGAGIGLGRAVEQSGLADIAAQVVLGAAGSHGPTALLAGVYALTWLLTSVLSNSAAAVLVFPVALRAVQTAGLAFEPCAIAIAIAASCEFTTSVGYQTNLMVQGPGGYRPIDYVRFGGPLTLICGAVTVGVLSWWY